MYPQITSYYLDKKKHILHTYIKEREHISFEEVYSRREAKFLIKEENKILKEKNHE